MILFLYGKDTFRSKTQLRKMSEKFKVDRDPQGLNFVHVDCVASGVKDLLTQMLAAPFLADKRMVVIERLMQNGDDDLCKELLKRIEEETVPQDLIWIFYEEGKPKKKQAKALYNRLQKEKYAEQFEVLEGGAFQGWVASIADEYGATVSREAAQRIAQDAGGDSWKAATLVQTVASYNSGGQVEVDDVALFVEPIIDDNIFGLVDAVLAGKSRKALDLFSSQLRVGKDAHFVFSMILRQARMLLDVKDAQDRGIDMAEVQKEMGIHPFAFKKTTQAAQQFDFSALVALHERLLDIDVKSKTGGGAYQILLEQMMFAPLR